MSKTYGDVWCAVMGPGRDGAQVAEMILADGAVGDVDGWVMRAMAEAWRIGGDAGEVPDEWTRHAAEMARDILAALPHAADGLLRKRMQDGMGIVAVTDVRGLPAGAIAVAVGPWMADDGNQEITCAGASSGREAAEEYVEGGDWGDDGTTSWVDIMVWRDAVWVEANGDVAHGRVDEETHKIAIEPAEPECADDQNHEWVEIDGTLRSSGGGVAYRQKCAHCGAERHVDTWAQDPCDGVQGLTSVRHER